MDDDLDLLYAVCHEGDILCTDMGVALIFIDMESANRWIEHKGLTVGVEGITIEKVEVGIVVEPEAAVILN